MANLGNLGVQEGLIGTLLEVLLFGVYIPIFLSCLRVFRLNRKSGAKRTYQVATFSLLTALCTARVILDAYRTVYAFTHPNADGTVEYAVLNSPLYISSQTLWVVETIVADLFIVYRVWVVWGKDWRLVIVPLLLILASIAGSIHALYILTTITGVAVAGNFDPKLHIGTDIFSYSTLFLNLLCTGLICFKIWSVRRHVAETGIERFSDPIRRLVNMIIESAAIYTILLVAVIVSIRVSSHLDHVFMNMVPPTIGIVFASIILRANQGLTFGDSTNTSSLKPPSSIHVHNHAGLFELQSTNSLMHDRDQPGRMKMLQGGVEIHLDRVQRVDGKSLDCTDKYGKEDV